MKMSLEEYQSLIAQIRADFSIQECQEELLDAARYADVDVVRALLHCHPDICHYQNAENGNTARFVRVADLEDFGRLKGRDCE